jgi:ABC-type phosphate/phosphonate transport system substrate-binding protein
MALEINGTAILIAIANSPAAFALSESQVNDLALNTLLSRFKDKSLGLGNIRSIMGSIGTHDLALALDHLPAKDVIALSKRTDPKHPEIKTTEESWHRNQILKLAEGTIEPASAAAKAVRAPKVPKPASKAKTGEIMKSKALKPRTATRK